MSDDDGLMLMNFSTSSEGNTSNNSATKVTGGKWKDRRKLKMMLNGKRAHKKRKIEDSANSVPQEFKEAESVPQTSLPANTRAQSSKAAPISNQQIVSSLFTSNREITTSVNTNEHDDDAKVNPSNAPLLQDSFEALGVKDPLLAHLSEKMRISKPTKIQKMAIPAISSDENDLFIHAQTGSGKTLAFLLPILSKILGMQTHVDRSSGCFAMVVTPTRELASQIYQVASTLTQCCHYIVPCLLIGGERKKSEKARLRKGCNLIIGTPGRILDHLQNTKVIREQLVRTLRYVVLDEGDKLMELGFEETIAQILQIIHEIPCDNSSFPQLPSRIIHVLCSATQKGGVTKLGSVALKNYKLISAGKKQQEVSTVPDQLLQRIVIVPPKLRLVTLAAVLNNITKEKTTPDGTVRTIVFLSCSDSVDFHYEAFSANSGRYRNLVGDTVRTVTKGNTVFPCFDDDTEPNVIFYKLHGSLSQQTRTSTLQHFSTNNESTKGKSLIMFCTDVASRGLDLPHVSTVIEMDPPFAVEDHLHRIGRTARAGFKGESLLFLLPGEEEGYMDHIKPYHPKGWKLCKFDQDILKPAFQDVSVKRSDKEGKDSAEWDNNATTWHLNVERRVLGDSWFKELAAKGYMSHIRAYATHLSQEKKFFNIKCLHLGHLAKSFALRERPKAMAGIGNGGGGKKRGADDEKRPKEDTKSKMLRMARMALNKSVSEFNY